jgi:hypothetical protein
MADSAVNLGAGGYSDFSSMSMDEMLFGTRDPVAISRATRPSYDEFGQGYDYRDGAFVPAVDEEGYNLELTGPARSRALQGREFEQEVGRASPYEGMAEPAKLRGFSGAPELYLEEGGEVEGGIFSLSSYPTLNAIYNAPSKDEQNLVRTSGREGSEGAAIYYPEGQPTFEEILEQEYGYAAVPREFSEAPESERNQRPRHDMPTFQELEDARAHALMSAQMGLDYGPETAARMGDIAEGIDALPIPLIGNASPEDVAMDTRNNAFGLKLLKQAGVNAAPADIAKMVDSKVFEQLDRILGREPGARSFKSPEGGLDVYFPRNEQGYFQTSRSGYY